MANNSQENKELNNKIEEVKDMNENQFQENKGLNVISNEKAKSIAVAGTTTRKSYNEDIRDDITHYLSKDIDKVYNDLGWNEKLNWSDRQREILYGKMKGEVELIKEQVKEVELMTKQEKEIKEIQKQLKETPVANITVEFADKGQFSIVNAQTKQVMATNTADVIKSTLAVMSTMKLGDTSVNENQV